MLLAFLVNTECMGKEKFIYNTNTLTYEKVIVPLKTRIWQAFGFFSVVLVTAGILLVLFYTIFPSPREQELIGEIEGMSKKYEQLNQQVSEMERVLANVQERDADVHRAVFGMNPIDENVWNAGVGGHDNHPELQGFKYGAATLKSSIEKIDLLARHLTVQSKSLDTLQQLAHNQQEMLACLPSIKPVREDKLKRSIHILSGFGWRIHPIFKVRKFHAGVDFPAREGTAIQATGDGKVEFAGKKSGYGNCVIIDHGYGYKTLYGHMHRMDVKRGEKVKKGQKIGEVGDTGISTAPHLHYEVHHKGKEVNPINFCMDGLSTTEYQEMVDQANSASQSFD